MPLLQHIAIAIFFLWLFVDAIVVFRHKTGAAENRDRSSFHVLTKYVKVTFFEGLSLAPIPPGGTPKSGQSRWIDIYEGDQLDETQMSDWLRQAADLPGWTP